jgi:hypothetical protein
MIEVVVGEWSFLAFLCVTRMFDICVPYLLVRFFLIKRKPPYLVSISTDTDTDTGHDNDMDTIRTLTRQYR